MTKHVTNIGGNQVNVEGSARTGPITQTIPGGSTPERDKIRALFIAANPDLVRPLALDEEVRAIEAKIRASEHRDAVEFRAAWAARPDDLIQKLNEHRPHIVHFSGHGTTAEQIVLVGDDGRPKPVTKAALSALFQTLKDNVRLVVLNACYSRPQAELIVETIDCAVGMNAAIGDKAAIFFAASFYRAIGFGRSVQEAFEQGRVSLLLEGVPEETIPELLVRRGVDASKVVLVGSRP